MLRWHQALDPIIRELELQILQQANQHNWVDYQLLQTIPDVGEIFALMILYETHDIRRFATVQRYSSSAGVVKRERTSGGKTYAAKNTKIRNAYLKWAFGEIIIKAHAEERIGQTLSAHESQIWTRQSQKSSSLIALRWQLISCSRINRLSTLINLSTAVNTSKSKESGRLTRFPTDERPDKSSSSICTMIGKRLVLIKCSEAGKAVR